MAHEMPIHEHVEVTNTGIDNRKLGFWLFISSETIFFASLLVAYLIYHGQNGEGPSPHDVFNIPLTSVSTFVLLMSSLAMALAVNSSQNGLAKQARNWVAVTAVMGMVFLGFQVFEFSHFALVEGLTLSSSLFGTTFYVLTGFHGAHVAVGVIWLWSLFGYGRKGLAQDKAGDVEVAGLYWHFVDIVWIVLFTVLYLLEFAQ